MRTFSIGGRRVYLFPSAQPQAPIVYLNTFGEEGKAVQELLRESGCPPVTLAAVSGLDWHRDMAPWDAPSAFKNGEAFTGGAESYLALLTREILPRVEALLPSLPCWRGIAGYSLAGLFALYALYHTPLFSRAASISGSLWFPGIKEYIFTHQPCVRPQRLYFSLGDRESKTRNSLLQQVEPNTREIFRFFQSQGVEAVFQMNPGGHHYRSAQRTAAGIRWLLQK